MCMGGGSTSTQSLRRKAGSSTQRGIQTQSLQSVFNPGTYNINNTRRLTGYGDAIGSFDQSNSGFRKDRSRGVYIGSQAEYDRLRNENIAVKQRSTFGQQVRTGKKWQDAGT